MYSYHLSSHCLNKGAFSLLVIISLSGSCFRSTAGFF